MSWSLRRVIATCTCLGSISVGCGGAHSDIRSQSLPQSLDDIAPSVVDMIAQRDGLSTDEAKAYAGARLRLAKLRLSQTSEDNSPEEGKWGLTHARLQHLERGAMSQLWLKDHFEPKYGPDAIPAATIEKNIESLRLFHPDIVSLCNVIVVPNEKPVDGKPAAAPDTSQWRTKAQAFGQDFFDRVQAYVPNPGTEIDCSLFQKAQRLQNRVSDDKTLRIKVEEYAMDVCRTDKWAAGFVDALCGKITEPSWIGPFSSEYGIHLVAAIQLIPKNLPENEERRAILRKKMTPNFRKSKYQQIMAKLRKSEILWAGSGGVHSKTQ